MKTEITPVAEGTSGRTAGWQMWIPCIAMAACSWLAFVDRQVLAVLSPTILKETGLSAKDYGTAFSFFFYVYAAANLIWGSLLDYLGLQFGNGRCRCILESGKRQPTR
jgi:MFS family permease